MTFDISKKATRQVVYERKSSEELTIDLSLDECFERMTIKRLRLGKTTYGRGTLQ